MERQVPTVTALLAGEVASVRVCEAQTDGESEGWEGEERVKNRQRCSSWKLERRETREGGVQEVSSQASQDTDMYVQTATT